MGIDYITNRIKNKEDKLLLEKAFNFVNLKDEILINHILGIVNTLIDFNADITTLISSILCECECIKNGVYKEEIANEFGIDISEIAYIASKISMNEENNKDYFDKLNVDSHTDVRALFIKLAERLYIMKNESSEHTKEIARETFNILIPAARRLRLNYINSKLEDLCLFYLEPEAYNYILNKLNAAPDILVEQLNNMKKEVSNLLIENNINFTIKGRVKNFYSIYNKLLSGKSWDEIYDILALRIIVDDEIECSRVVEVIRFKYMSLSFRFKDYIKNPKENMYQSLHMTVIGEDNKFYEIQIRTKKMDKTAEIGDASHQQYKQKTLKNNKI